MKKIFDMEKWEKQQRVNTLLDICGMYGLDVDGDVFVQDGIEYFIYATQGLLEEINN